MGVQEEGYHIQKVGISPDRIWITGYSQYRPLVPNTSDENRKKNRRVEIHILYKGGANATPSQLYPQIEQRGLEVEGRQKGP